MANVAVAIRRAFVAASAMWAAAIPIATAGSALPSPTAPVSMFTVGVFAIGAAVCHQLPERSFHLWGRQFPVCARCTGIYVATAMVGIALMLARRGQDAGTSAHARPLRLWMGAAALALNVLTLVYEWTTGGAPSNIVRAAAGAALGAVVATLVVYDVN